MIIYHTVRKYNKRGAAAPRFPFVHLYILLYISLFLLLFLSLLLSLFLRALHREIHLAHHVVVSALAVRHHASRAVFDPVFVVITEVPAAVFLQKEQRAIAEQTVERIRVARIVTREEFALLVLKEFVVFAIHTFCSFSDFLVFDFIILPAREQSDHDGGLAYQVILVQADSVHYVQLAQKSTENG